MLVCCSHESFKTNLMDCSSLITSDRLRYSLSLAWPLASINTSLYRLIDSAFRVASYVLPSVQLCFWNTAGICFRICHVEGGEKTVASFSMPVQDQEGKTETKSRELIMMTSSFSSYFPACWFLPIYILLYVFSLSQHQHMLKIYTIKPE